MTISALNVSATKNEDGAVGVEGVGLTSAFEQKVTVLPEISIPQGFHFPQRQQLEKRPFSWGMDTGKIDLFNSARLVLGRGGKPQPAASWVTAAITALGLNCQVRHILT